MTPLQWQLLILTVAVVVGALIIFWVRRSRSAVERYRRSAGGPRMLRNFVELHLRPLPWYEAVAALAFAALAWWATSYFGWEWDQWRLWILIILAVAIAAKFWREGLK